MKARCLDWFIVLFAFGLLGSARAEELGFPKRCVELQRAPSDVWPDDTFSSRDSVLFRMGAGSPMATNGDSRSFVAWDTETGKLLARRPAPGSIPIHWQFSPDGTLLAVPMFGHARIIQLYEVGPKDPQGVPRLNLTAELRPKEKRLKGPSDAPPPLRPHIDVEWTPDGKTLIAGYNSYDRPLGQILFWSLTDKPSVWAVSP